MKIVLHVLYDKRTSGKDDQRGLKRNYNLPDEPVHELVVKGPESLNDPAPDAGLKVDEGAQDGQDDPAIANLCYKQG